MIKEAYVVPHPPILLKEVGKGQETKAEKTLQAYEKIADRVAEIKPELIIISSPHAILYRDWFNISSGEKAYGDMEQFNADEVSFEVDYDTEFVDTLKKVMPNDFPCGPEYDREKELDHGTMVPLYFINQKYKDYKLVRIGLSGFPLTMHYALGMYIREAVNHLNRKAVWIASGDLSHCMQGSHYGVHPEGEAYDEKLMKTLSTANFGELLSYDNHFLHKAMECGHRSFTMMAGAMDGLSVKTEVLSHEAPWGIGYGIAIIQPQEKDEARHFLKQEEEKNIKQYQERYDKADPFVKLAYDQVFRWVREHQMIHVDQVPEDMRNRAGVFVSIHENGELRGCIGTIEPRHNNIADEIIHNAIAACSRDPRFSPVMEEELDMLEITVDVLSPAERIQDTSELDIHRYGVICSTEDGRRGLLLPDLDGVNSVEDQVRIACEKGNIDPESDDVILERFEVVRHY